MCISIETVCCVDCCSWTGFGVASDNKQGESQRKERMTATSVVQSLQERKNGKAVEHVRLVIPESSWEQEQKVRCSCKPARAKSSS